MVNSSFANDQVQRWAIVLSVFGFVGAVFTPALHAQNTYANQNYTVQSSSSGVRVARAPQPTPSAFPAVFAEPPAPTPTQNDGGEFTALSRTFAASTPKAATPSGKLQDIFGENPQGDAFGEQDAAPAASPFQKLESTEPQDLQGIPDNPFGEIVRPPTSTQQQVPDENPFGEIKPQEPQQEAPGGNPFSELPADPSPITPPMDTNPVTPQQVEPRLPDGSEFTPDPGLIDPNPPIPGEDREPPVRKTVELPEDPGKQEADPEEPEQSIFDRKDDDEDDLRNEDVGPIPSPASSKVYLPARSPSDYVKPPTRPQAYMVPPQYDPRMMTNNPYAGLPGPYGYAAPPNSPYPTPYAAPPYGPYGYQQPMPPMQAPAPYGQCGPGCVPANQSSIVANEYIGCDNCSIANCGGCSQCSQCAGSNRPSLPQTDIGDRIVETACVDGCDDTYTEVVSDCDGVCSNFASCYVGVFGGWSNLNDFITRGDVGNGVYFDDSGTVFGFTIGQIQGRNLRTELELSYRNIGVNGLRLEGSAPSQFVSVNGDFGTFAGMLNAYWEFVDLGTDKIKPYLGGGVGFAIARPELLQANGVEAVIDNNDSSFAWQWMAGLNYKASPTLDAFVEYRYFVADSFRLDTEIPEVVGLGNGSGRFDYQSSNVLFGLRARF